MNFSITQFKIFELLKNEKKTFLYVFYKSLKITPNSQLSRTSLIYDYDKR